MEMRFPLTFLSMSLKAREIAAGAFVPSPRPLWYIFGTFISGRVASTKAIFMRSTLLVIVHKSTTELLFCQRFGALRAPHHIFSDGPLVHDEPETGTTGNFIILGVPLRQYPTTLAHLISSNTCHTNVPICADPTYDSCARTGCPVPWIIKCRVSVVAFGDIDTSAQRQIAPFCSAT